MPIAATCGSCGKTYQVNDNMAGKQARCGCGGVISIPNAPAPMQQMPYQQAPVQQPMPTASFGGGFGQPSMGGGYGQSRPRGTVNANDILMLVFGILALAHGGLYGWWHGKHSFPLIDRVFSGSINSFAETMARLYIVVHFLAFFATLAVAAAGICFLVDAIIKLTGNRFNMSWDIRVGASAGTVYLALTVVIFILALILIIKWASLMSGGKTVGEIFKALAWMLGGAIVPVGYAIIFFRRKRR